MLTVKDSFSPLHESVTCAKCGDLKSSNFPFVLQKNGSYALDLSADKKMVLSLFKGNVYCHIWNNKNQKHVSLNSDELMHVLSNEADIEHITRTLVRRHQTVDFNFKKFKLE